MSKRKTYFTVRDELVFAEEATIVANDTYRINEDNPGKHCTYFDHISQILEHGAKLGQSVHVSELERAKSNPTEDEKLSRWFRGACSREDLDWIFDVTPRPPGDFRRRCDDADLPRERIVISPELAARGDEMAANAYRLMISLNAKEAGNREHGVGLAARLHVSAPGFPPITTYFIKAQLDYVEILPGRKVFVGAYDIIPSCSESAVRRYAHEKNWPARAYLGQLLASAYFGLPVDSAFVGVSSAPPLPRWEGGYDDWQQCRSYEVSPTSLEEGRKLLIRGIFRSCRQVTSDEEYLRHLAI